MKLTKYQLIKVKVDAPGLTVKFSAETDKLYQFVQGIFVSMPKDDFHFGTTLELKIAEQEIFPEGFETKLLAASQHTSPNERFLLFENDELIEAKGSHIEGRIVDGAYMQPALYPYTLYIYFKLKNEPDGIKGNP